MVIANERKLDRHHFISVKSQLAILLSTLIMTLLYHFATDGVIRDFLVMRSLSELGLLFLICWGLNAALVLLGVSLLEGKNARRLLNYLVMGFQLGCIPPVLIYIESNFFKVTGLSDEVFDLVVFFISFPVFIASGLYSALVYWAFSFSESTAWSVTYITISTVVLYFCYFFAYTMLLTV
jgi:hypothetical protein